MKIEMDHYFCYSRQSWVVLWPTGLVKALFLNTHIGENWMFTVFLSSMDIDPHHLWLLLLTLFNFNPSMDK